MKIKHYQPLTYITTSIVGITVLAGILLSNNAPIFPSTSNASAIVNNATSSATIRVESSCSMTATIEPGEEHVANLLSGQYQADIGITTIQTFCNDPNGYAIYAIGYTGGDAGVASGTNTVLHSSALGSDHDIPTNTYTSGNVSGWAMKLTAVNGTYRPTILNSFDAYHAVPQSYTKVVSYGSNTDLTTVGSSITTTYAAYAKPTQAAGTYEGQVKFVLLHPASSPSPTPDYRYMQDVADWGGSVAVGQEVTAFDSRDNKSYTVRRMCKSGSGDSCSIGNSILWMTQNLDLNLSSSSTLSSEDTDLNVSGSGAYSSGYSTNGSGTIYWTPSSSTITNINNSTGAISDWSNSKVAPYSVDPEGGSTNYFWYGTGTNYNSSLCFVNSNPQTCDYLMANNTLAQTYFQKTAFSANGSHGKMGNYYNWTSAIASNNSSSLSTNTYDNVANNPQNSICPKGWRLPTVSSVSSRNEFTLLNNVYNSGSTSTNAGLFNAPVFLTYGGYVYNSILAGSGYYGYYWSSTNANADSAYVMGFTSSYVSLNDNSNRGRGRSVRCVADY